MKKISLLILTFILILSLCSCKISKGTADNMSATENSSVSNEENTESYVYEGETVETPDDVILEEDVFDDDSTQPAVNSGSQTKANSSSGSQTRAGSSSDSQTRAGSSSDSQTRAGNGSGSQAQANNTTNTESQTTNILGSEDVIVLPEISF